MVGCLRAVLTLVFSPSQRSCGNSLYSYSLFTLPEIIRSDPILV
jgi:hypothetical protein